MLRNLGLRVRLVLVFVPLIAIFMAFNYFLIITHEQEILTGEAQQRAVAMARVLSSSSAQAIATLNTHDLQLSVDSLRTLRDVTNVLVLNEAGGIEASPEIADVGHTCDDPIVTQVLHGPAVAEPTVETDEKKGTLQVAAPIVINGKVKGAVSVTLSLASLRAAVAQSRGYVLILTGLLIVVALVFMLVVAHWFTGPILRLARVARAIAAGDIERRATVRGGDEIGVLGDAFNEMAERLRGLMENERAAHENLQGRVSELLERADRVAGGDLEGAEAPESPDEMGRLAAGFNDMVRNLRHHTRIQQATLFELEESHRALAEANRQLKEMDRLKSEFLNTVSHELRTPLTSIKAFSEILLDTGADDPDSLHEFLGIINQESDRLTRLINNLLDLSRIEAGRMQWDMMPVDLREIGESCAATARALADKGGVTLAVEIAEPLVVVGDRDKLIQVLTNLLSNAIKFTKAGGCVTLSGRRVGAHVEVVVRDSGIGIPKEHHERIFEKFAQVDTSSTREIKGSGLGLPIVRSILEAHGGRVWVESEPGSGSAFFVTMPLPDTDPGPVLAPAVEAGEALAPSTGTAPREGAAAPRHPRRGQTVLVVDDEANIVRVIRHILESEGYAVLEAGKGEDALRLAREGKPDLILLDLLLPDIDGFEVLRRLRADGETAPIPVVVLSILEARDEAFGLGAQDYCSKPLDRARLLETVQGLLGNATETRILVVDDDPHILAGITQMLSSRGYHVLAARDGLEAVVKARDERPSLLVLDLYMPEMDGFEVIRRLRTWDETARMPIVVLTASDIALDEARVSKLGAEVFLSKPFSEQALTQAVHDVLSRRFSKEAHGGAGEVRSKTEV